MSRLLYDESFEHDNCGIGAVVHMKGEKSHSIVADALKIVENLEHRAGKDARGETGDGVGVLTQIPHRFFAKVCRKNQIKIGEERSYGIGMFFFPQDELTRCQAMKMFEVIVKQEGMEFSGWRKVPVAPNVLGEKARRCMPAIYQGFVQKPQSVENGIAFDRKLYVARRVFEQSNHNTYVVSLSSRTIVYKGMFLVHQLGTFFLDLQDLDYESAIAMVHSRFSTNTNPSWERAHPNRLMVHNGEINTIKGNADKMIAREETMQFQEMSQDELTKVLPVINAKGSDSAMMDNALEFLMMNGMDLPLAAMIMVPEPWSDNDTISQARKDFYQYYATMMEPWDGPASILFSDGDVMGALLDRNGLRPSRYYVMDDGRLILASEVGALDIEESHVVKKERLHPGKMLLIDTVKGKMYQDEEIKELYAQKEPYGEWLDGNLLNLKDRKIPNEAVPSYTKEERARLQINFGYSYEEYRESIFHMALNGAEQIGAMGIDTPIAALSEHYQPLYYYFKQLFAQVTNPPIDAIREKIVTSTTVYIGKEGNLLQENPKNCQVLKVDNPILTDLDLLKMKNLDKEGFKVVTVPIIFYKSTPMDRVLERLFMKVDRAYKEGASIIILSDRGVDENHVAIPSLLAVAAVNRHLVQTRKCTAISLVVESGEPRLVHDFATLLGYGASAINPYLAHATIEELIENQLLNKDYYAAVEDYDHAILHGIVKIASKMGISTIQSYQGSKMFEAIGISEQVIDTYFTGTVSRIGGITLEQIAECADKQHSKAFDPLGLEQDLSLQSIGRHKMRSQGEQHRYNPQTIHLLQKATREGDYELFSEYTKLIDCERTGYLRSYLDFVYPKKGIGISEVEDEYSIVKRFKTGAMSYGSISEEAHEALAIAMNHLKGKSNSGEGGESDERIDSLDTDNNRCSAIKQVASGRFGVTSRYLVHAKEIQIKLAQGAKPGEGGHLPGKKVYPWVAKTRHSTPGVSLISPPPHHDIYSIEDLAQLIYDLKNANKEARISVKLVSEAGVGTVAAGVAKAGAQVILVAGYDGGTGAAPISSIHNAGLPWELGLAEAHQTLIQNGLRKRVVVETDGKLMSGRDVAIAALLGAEEFGFSTAPLVALGCVMMRVCNQDTCPVGIATQNPQLRKRFMGKPEYVENFMLFIARQLREYMAKLGFRTVDEMVGKTHLLKQKDVKCPNDVKLDLSRILASVKDEKLEVSDNMTDVVLGEIGDITSGKVLNENSGNQHKQLSVENDVFHPEYAYDFELEKTKDETVLLQNEALLRVVKQATSDSEQHQKLKADIVANNVETTDVKQNAKTSDNAQNGKTPVTVQNAKKSINAQLDVDVKNTDRTFGTQFGSYITKHHPQGLPEDTIRICCKGSAGQSFGAFIPKGLTLELCGDSNDYLGKGLSGGKIVVYAPKEAKYNPAENILVGNVVLYGATSGEVYIAGMAGERFGVRNSGVTAVVEGVGEHGCEYMTGGKVVVLGRTGKNFAAGMSGGVAYVLDEENRLYRNLNKEMVLMEQVETKEEQEQLRRMIEKHVQHTYSKKATQILEKFDDYIQKFKKIIPIDYKKMVELCRNFEQQGMNQEQAQIEAFYASQKLG